MQDKGIITAYPAMPTFDIENKEITAFEFNQTYLFKQSFDEDGIFQQLGKYYNSNKYGFKVQEEKLSKVNQILNNFFYELEDADQLQKYCLVQNKKAYSSDILRNLVTHQRRWCYDIFLMKDEISVRQAIEKGATPPEKRVLNTGSIQWKIDGS
ncbi:hypothetical protein OB919_11615 [Halobacteria archaeon AArc-curdl1]|uniref:Uncharacterized protein n=1 Tax=Natronosalvus hydrolyticus TaxID=2979988 RepID=A0AAP2Z951_9EURY|nr:hypothetical protein [Halobacteria archaeon AArc-curdl1]